ncbi:carboxypeptidase inhibitor-like [Rhipicephalus microplus]|uniref:Putative carboxypeptidase inhibitor n=1 Tax=Rhipicephalus microplus TaxID=6941 RepID=A0A6G5A8F3_RHIMP
MMFILLLLAVYFALNAAVSFKIRKCYATGYGCMPFSLCLAKYWVVRHGCGLGSVCCNLGKLNACSLAGGSCRQSCRTRMRSIRCPGLKRCCADEIISYRPHRRH